jgi:hypothetical protein
MGLLAGPQPAVVLDDKGEEWAFCRETVQAVTVGQAAVPTTARGRSQSQITPYSGEREV